MALLYVAIAFGGQIDASPEGVDEYVAVERTAERPNGVSRTHSRDLRISVRTPERKPSVDISDTSRQPDAEVVTYEMTAYTARCEGCSGITASGYDVRHTKYSSEGFRIVASDNGVLPLGTVIRVTLPNGDAFKAKVLDRGSAINGAELDLLVNRRSKALRFGRQDVRVTVIGED